MAPAARSADELIAGTERGEFEPKAPAGIAVPPMFEVTISMITSGIGSMSSASASRKVIGTISSTVVR